MYRQINKQYGDTNGTTNKIVLIFPPVWDNIDMPYLALPSLAAYLRSKDVEVEARDLNIEYYRDILNSQSLEKIGVRISSLVRKDDIPLHQKSSLAVAKTLLPFVEDNIDDAKTKLASQYDHCDFQKSLRCINAAKGIVSSLCYPSELMQEGIISPYDQTNLPEILKGATDKTGNLFRSYFEEKTKELFVQNNFVMTGISITGESQLIPAFTLANVIKTINPDIPVIMGGAMLPYMRKAIKNFPKIFSFADYFVVGEGETALFLLYKYFKGEGDLQNIPNLLYKSEDNNVIETSWLCENVDELPTPDFDGFPLDVYNDSERLPLQTSRGCNWHRCAFCGLCQNSTIKYRERNLELVMDDIELLMNNNKIEHVEFCDEGFIPSRLSEMCEALERREIADKLKYIIFARFDSKFDLNLLRKAHSTGLRFIGWGLESASKTILRKMRKGISPEIGERCLQDSHACGIWNNVFVMFGFLGESEEDAKTTTNYILKNGEYIDSVIMNLFHLDGDSDIHRRPEKYGITVRPVPPTYIGPRYSYSLEDGTVIPTTNLGLTDSMQKFLNAIGPKHFCMIYLSDIILTGGYILEHIGNSFEEKQKCRSIIKSKIKKTFDLIDLTRAIESLLLWLPDYVEIKKIDDMPEEIGYDIMIINHKTGDVQVPTKKVTPYILKVLQEKTAFHTLVKHVVEKLSKFGKDEISKEVKDVCCFLLVMQYLRGEL